MTTPTASSQAPEKRPGTSQATIPGASASPGIAYGPVRLHLDGLEDQENRSIDASNVDQELARLDSVARAARVSLVRQREALASHFTKEQRRVFDTHLKLLEDPVIEADVRERITNQCMSLEAAVKDALQVYERLFEVVESEGMRSRMSDMRDVALRYLRFCERPQKTTRRTAVKGSVLVVRELSLSDLTEALEFGVTAIVAEGGNQGSHGAILTRAAGVPAVLGVGRLQSRLREGDMLLVDGDSGQLEVNPTMEMVTAALGRQPEELHPLGPACLADGEEIDLVGAVASPSEARAVATMGVRKVGVYRTDLPVLQRQGNPKEASLTALYRQVVNATEEVHFRLPDLSSSSEVDNLYDGLEPNPAMGLRGCRLLFANPDLLSKQIAAVLRAAEDQPVHIAAPFINDPSDLDLIRESIDRVREELRLEGVKVNHPVALGAIVETPSAALLGREIIQAADFIWIGLDTLKQMLMAADRRCEHALVLDLLDGPPPVLLRAVDKLNQIADGTNTPLGVYGEDLAHGPMLPLMVGLGVRRFALRPILLRAAHMRLQALDAAECEDVASDVVRMATRQDVQERIPSNWYAVS